MKIGIVTIYDAYNYGSFLQAFALQEFLINEGHEVYILDFSVSLKSRKPPIKYPLSLYL